MKKLASLLWVVIMMLLPACTVTSVSTSTPPAPTAPAAASPAPTPEASEDPITAAINSITDSLSSKFEKDTCKVSYSGNVLTVTGSLEGLTDTVAPCIAAESGAPGTWSDTIASVEALGAEAAEAAKQTGLDITSNVLYIVSNDGAENIYLTLIDGKLIFNIFGEASKGANPETISLAEYNEIKEGMTYEEVVNIVGSYGEVLSDADLFDDSEYRTIMYSWEGEGSLGANANIMVQGGKVISKAQFGLE